MPKRKSQKTNASPSQEEAAPTQLAILRVVKQEDTTTDSNNPVQSQSASTDESEPD
ncbi:hypothetical protein [uncultured Nostoc sp.]|uniref:hypothetical protein n=1 Tax=uncultured Nostoc sp. TaxID=340711 RepID=UPI0035CAEDFD